MAVLLAPLTAGAEAASVVLIAHSDVEIGSLTRDTTRAIFAMRQRSWPNGQAVRVFVLPGDHPLHGRFAKERLAVYPHQLQLAWDRMVFSGTGQAPTEVDSPEAMLERVATTPGGIGYLTQEHLDERVQVITVE